MVSLTSIAPLYKINSDTAMPISPSSRAKPVTWVSTAAIKTTLVVITSLRASAAVASSVSESMRRPMVRLRWLIHSLTRMDATSTTTVSQPKLTGVGSSVLAKLSLNSSTPMTKIITETASPARYSYRAWP